MENDTNNFPFEKLDLEIKKEPEDEYFSPECASEPLRSLVLKFVRDKKGDYSVIPLIKPDPFFEENLDDDFCFEEKRSPVKIEAPDKEEITSFEMDNNEMMLGNIGENCTNNNTIDHIKKEQPTEKCCTLGDNNTSYCSKCLYANSPLQVRRHMQRVHPVRTRACPFCDKTNFKEPLAMEGHILAKHMDVKGAKAYITRKIHSCSFCQYKTLKRGNCRRHLTTHGDNKLKDHLQKQSELNTNSIVGNASEFEIKMALKITTYGCYHCPYKTRSRSSLVRHVRLHKTSKYMPFSCTVCDRRFNEKKSLDSHIVKRHWYNKPLLKTLTRSIYECDKCDYKDVSKHKVARHKRARHVKKERKRRNLDKRNSRSDSPNETASKA